MSLSNMKRIVPWRYKLHVRMLLSSLIEWISKARLHRGCNPNSVQHCIMAALRTLGSLQWEHVHCNVRGLADLRSQAHELSCALVKAHNHWPTPPLQCADRALAVPNCALSRLASCLSTVFARGGSFLCDGPTSARCIAMSSPGRWEASLEFAGSARTMLTSSAHLGRYRPFLAALLSCCKWDRNCKRDTHGTVLQTLDGLCK